MQNTDLSTVTTNAVNLLLIEDDLVDQRVFKKAFEKSFPESTLTIVNSISEAREKLASHYFEIIFCDFYLGDGSALDIISFTDVPVVVVTGSNELDTAINTMKMGAKDYLIKDYNNKHLELMPIVVRRTIEAHLNELKVKLANERFKDLFENTNDLIQSVTDDGSFQYVNPSWLKTLGFSQDDLEHLREVDIIHQNDKEKYLLLMEEIRKGTEVHDFEIRLINKTGKIIYVSGASNHKQVNPAYGYSRTIFRNITERKVSEINLLNSERFYRALIESASDPIYRLNTQFDFDFSNPRAANLFGCSQKAINGQNILQFVPENYTEKVKKHYEKVLKDKPDQDYYEFPITCQDSNELIWIGQSSTIIYDQSGTSTISGLHTIARNITEQKRLHEALIITNEELENLVNKKTAELKNVNKELKLSNKELDLYLYHSSHNLLGPVMRLLGLVNLIKHDYADGFENILSMMEDVCYEMRRMIEKLSWVTILNEETSKNDFFINEVIDEVISETKDMIKNKATEINIKSNIKQSCKTSKKLVKIIIRNLLENAIQFTQEINAPKIEIGAKIREHDMVVWVNDNGEGIPQEHLPRVADMFFKAHERSKGNGLGLYLVSRALKKLNATINIDSKLNNYTNVVIEIPK